jgi:hypothetical protein
MLAARNAAARRLVKTRFMGVGLSPMVARKSSEAMI